jgi:hypothetical protein
LVVSGHSAYLGKTGIIMPFLLINKLHRKGIIIQHQQNVNIKQPLRIRNGVDE